MSETVSPAGLDLRSSCSLVVEHHQTLLFLYFRQHYMDCVKKGTTFGNRTTLLRTPPPIEDYEEEEEEDESDEEDFSDGSDEVIKKQWFTINSRPVGKAVLL